MHCVCTMVQGSPGSEAWAVSCFVGMMAAHGRLEQLAASCPEVNLAVFCLLRMLPLRALHLDDMWVYTNSDELGRAVGSLTGCNRECCQLSNVAAPHGRAHSIVEFRAP